MNGQAEKKWYSNRYRRHLTDMHIDDWNEVFLREFSPEVYLENLKKAHINNAMIYLQAHTGLCYWPTRSGVMHRAFRGREDTVKRLIDMCRANDIRVTGYYSFNYNTAEHDRHPEWRMLMANGISRREAGGVCDDGALTFASRQQARYGLLCPNQWGYREFVRDQMREIIDYFDLDALFIDMPFWPHTCYCPACRERWKKETGNEMPVDPAKDQPEYVRLIGKQYEWMGDWTRWLREEIRKKASQLPVEYNYSGAISGVVGTGEEVNESSDYVGGDLYGGIFEESFACKFYRNSTRNQPFEYMFSRCKPALRMHTLTKTEDEMTTAMAITAAHHGATLVIDAIDPVGTMDARVYERVGKCFEKLMPAERYFTGKMEEPVGIYYGIRSLYDAKGENHTCKQSSLAIARELTARHIPYGVTGAFHDLSGYSVLIAPMLSAAEEKDNARLIDYVKNGGRLYLSGDGNRELLRELLGIRFTGSTCAEQVYLRPTKEGERFFGWFNEKYPMPFEGTAPIVAGLNDAEVYARLTLPYTNGDEVRYASIHSNPPGIDTDAPMIVRKKAGKGEVIWCAVPVESMPYPEYAETVMALLAPFLRETPFMIATDAPGSVEVTHFRDENGSTIHAVEMNDASRAVVTGSFTVKLRTKKRPLRVYAVLSGRNVPFRYEEGCAIFETGDFRITEVFRIE